MLKIKMFVLVTLIALSGCASTEYKAYTEAQAKIATSKSDAESERYKALAVIAQSGDATARVAAVMAIALGQNNSNSQQNTITAPPQNQLLQWAQLLIPSVTQLYGINANLKLGTVQSNNSAAIAESTNNAFVGIADKIQAPAANITTTTTLGGNGTIGSGTYTTSDLSGTGTLGSGAYTTTDSHNASTVDSHSTATDDHTTTPAAKVCSVDSTGTLVCL